MRQDGGSGGIKSSIGGPFIPTNTATYTSNFGSVTGLPTATMNNPFTPIKNPIVSPTPFLGNPSSQIFSVAKPTSYGAIAMTPRVPTNFGQKSGGKGVKVLGEDGLFGFGVGNFVDFGIPSSAGFRFLPNQLRKTKQR